MSTMSVTPAEVATPAGEKALTARIAQIQALIAQTQAAASGTGSPTAAGQTSFANALQAASATPATAVAASYQGAAGSEPTTSQYDGLIEQAAQRNGLDPAVLHGLIQQESDFNPGSQSTAGAMGLTQLMPDTASSLGVANPMNPAESIEGGARYLSGLMKEFGGNTTDALAAYNAGPGAVKQYGGVPPYAETQSYVTKVLGYAEAYRQSHPATLPTGAVT
jgi:soluble lytic murein transglycosylase-like protein